MAAQPICISIVTVKKLPNGKTLLGKRKLAECGQIMMQLNEHIFVCPLGHTRKVAVEQDYGFFTVTPSYKLVA